MLLFVLNIPIVELCDWTSEFYGYSKHLHRLVDQMPEEGSQEHLGMAIWRVFENEVPNSEYFCSLSYHGYPGIPVSRVAEDNHSECRYVSDNLRR